MDIPGLERALDILSVRSRTLAENLANADTPHYIRRDVPFFALMQAQFAGDDSSEIPVQEDHTASARGNGNNTSPERELSDLTETTTLYRAALELTSQEFSELRSAITEGRR